MSQSIISIPTTIVMVPVEFIQWNPHRDLKLFPWIDRKIESLKESIKETGFWGGLQCRPANNQIPGMTFENDEAMQAYLATIERVNFPVQVPYGHHRIKTLLDINADPKWADIKEIPLAITTISERDMVKMMAHENNDEYGGNVRTILETVNKVYHLLKAEVDEFEESQWKEYSHKYGSISTEKNFKLAKNQSHGIGFEMVLGFLGADSWGRSAVEGPLKAVKAAEEGLIALEDFHDVGSGSLLLECIKLIEMIKDPKLKVPERIKNKWATAFTSMVKKDSKDKDDVKLTNAVVRSAISKLKAECDPIWYITKTDSRKYDVLKLIIDELKDLGITDLDKALALEGWDGFEGEVREAIDRITETEERRAERLRKQEADALKAKADAELKARAKALADANEGGGEPSDVGPSGQQYPNSDNLVTLDLSKCNSYFTDRAKETLAALQNVNLALTDTEAKKRILPLQFVDVIRDMIAQADIALGLFGTPIAVELDLQYLTINEPKPEEPKPEEPKPEEVITEEPKPEEPKPEEVITEEAKPEEVITEEVITEEPKPEEPKPEESPRERRAAARQQAKKAAAATRKK